jgi:hypothetical protein
MLSLSLKKSLLISTLLTAFCFSAANAKMITLYDQPNKESKTIGSIDSGSSMVPIFTSKDGAWMKVGDPKNGAVGWAKVSDLSSSNQNGFSFSQQTVSTPDGPKTTIQFGVPQPMSSAQIKEMQKRQEELQKSIQNMVNGIYHNAFYGNPAVTGIPVYMPIIVVPQQMLEPSGTAAKPVAPAVPAPMQKPHSNTNQQN